MSDLYGIYLHIPYCRAKCRYCDFYSAPGARGVPQPYTDALLRELAKNDRRPDTLYFGGGTPALLTPQQVESLITAANPLPEAEITLEANPDVVIPGKTDGLSCGRRDTHQLWGAERQQRPTAAAGAHPYGRGRFAGPYLGAGGRVCGNLRRYYAGPA